VVSPVFSSLSPLSLSLRERNARELRGDDVVNWEDHVIRMMQDADTIKFNHFWHIGDSFLLQSSLIKIAIKMKPAATVSVGTRAGRLDKNTA